MEIVTTFGRFIILLTIMHFDYNVVLYLQYHLAMSEADTIEKAKYDKLKEVLGWTKGFVAETGYVAGTEKLTIADLCFLATLTTILDTGKNM